MPEMQEQFPVSPWTACMPEMQEQFPVSPWTACMPEMQEQFPALRAPGQADGDRETAHKWRR
jgi:hypothetical protein